MTRFRVIVTDQVFPSIDLERQILAEIGAEIDVADGTSAGVSRLAMDADALLTTYLPIGADLISELRRCRVIARYGIGVDNIDLRAANEAGIVVTNVPNYCVEEVAVHAFAMILSLLRRLPAADAQVKAGGWGIDRLRPVPRLSELTFGLVGYGRIARRLAAGIDAFGGRLLVHDPFLVPAADLPPLVTLDELIHASDVISIHAPATSETRGLFDAGRMASMKPGALLVNTSRGPLVVLEDLAEALRSGHLGGAALDVFEREPPAPEAIRDVPNLIVSPHMAYYSEPALAESQRKAATQVVHVLSGRAPDYPVHA